VKMPNVQPPIRRALCLNPEMSVDKKVSLSLLSLLLLAAVAMMEEDGNKRNTIRHDGRRCLEPDSRAKRERLGKGSEQTTDREGRDHVLSPGDMESMDDRRRGSVKGTHYYRGSLPLFGQERQREAGGGGTKDAR
jgi:predicted subunit of tRNA(5-methylaminomethyl-2-thiouridylate) methyltransferase